MATNVINSSIQKNNKKGKSKAESAPFLKPTLDLLFQTDFPKSSGPHKFGDINDAIYRYGCNMLCQLAIIQIMNNRRLTDKGIIKAYNLAKNNEWMARDQGENENDWCCLINRPVDFMNGIANSELFPDNKYRYDIVAQKSIDSVDRIDTTANLQGTDKLPGSNNIYFCIVKHNTSSSKAYGGAHFVLCNSLGLLIYDPHGKVPVSWKGTVNRIDFIKVTKL